MCNVPKLLKKGVRVTIGTDSVASNNSLNFIEEMKFFAALPKGVFHDPTAVTPKEVLFAATSQGALAQGRKNCGKMKVGYQADLIVLDIGKANMQPVYELQNNIVYSASGSDVILTMVDGRVLYDNGSYPTLDLEQIFYHVSRQINKITETIA